MPIDPWIDPDAVIPAPRVASQSGASAITFDGVRMPNPLPEIQEGSRVEIIDMRVPEDGPGIRVAAAWGGGPGWGTIDFAVLVSPEEMGDIEAWKRIDGMFRVSLDGVAWFLCAFDTDGGRRETLPENNRQFYRTRIKGQVLEEVL